MGFSKVIKPLFSRFPGVYIPKSFKEQAQSAPSFDPPSDPWEDDSEETLPFFYTTSKSVGFVTLMLVRIAQLVMNYSQVARAPRPRRKRKSKPV